jgi:DNA-binding PadR family transcriptional regulator
LQLVILALLEERPRHGYEIIKALEETSKGFYAPSPGMVYPALTYLEEVGYATVEAEGSKKLYQITAAGQSVLAEQLKTMQQVVRTAARRIATA